MILVISIFAQALIKVVREYQRLVVFRLGRVQGTKGPGLVHPDPVPGQGRDRWISASSIWRSRTRSAITEDNASISIDFIVFNKVMDPQMSVLTVGNFAGAAQNIAATTLRSVVGDMSLDDVLAKREQINEVLRDEARRGDRALGREGHQRGDPRDHPAARRAGGDDPADVGRAHAPRRRDRGRGHKQAAVTVAEGNKAAAILNAEGQKQAAILHAEGERQAAILRAEGFSLALDKINEVGEPRGDEHDEPAVPGHAEADRRRRRRRRSWCRWSSPGSRPESSPWRSRRPATGSPGRPKADLRPGAAPGRNGAGTPAPFSV